MLFLENLECRRLFATLMVGPGDAYALPSAAIAAAHDGDTILINTAGNYYNDVALIDKNNLTIEGVGAGRAVIATDGRVSGNKGIWDFAQGYQNLKVENIDFEGARVADSLGGNGAGIRAEGRNLTVLNCRFYNNQNGILGGSGTTDIEHSEFANNGLSGFTHNVYISDESGTLRFFFNYSHDTAVGHLLKSRAAVNEILYNRLSDDWGTGSYELDLPNGGRSDVIGNVIEQSASSQNGSIAAYGEEGIVSPKSELNVVNNTFVNYRSSATFINAGNLPPGFRVEVVNNIFAGPGNVISINGATPKMAGNLVCSVAGAGFVNAAAFDFSLQSTSPAIKIGVLPGRNGNWISLTSHYEYVFPTSGRIRKVRGRLDAGAYEYRGLLAGAVI